mmetsp:Transcript_4522/g.17110  ORF Transcript_4522/g.17110 Transcript_4522/m.17110 type:complete len:216 (+) Transcript_4522:3210-3857(+)
MAKRRALSFFGGFFDDFAAVEGVSSAFSSFLFSFFLLSFFPCFSSCCCFFFFCSFSFCLACSFLRRFSSFFVSCFGASPASAPTSLRRSSLVLFFFLEDVFDAESVVCVLWVSSSSSSSMSRSGKKLSEPFLLFLPPFLPFLSFLDGLVVEIRSSDWSSSSCSSCMCSCSNSSSSGRKSSCAVFPFLPPFLLAPFLFFLPAFFVWGASSDSSSSH